MPFARRFSAHNSKPFFPIHTLPQKLDPSLISSVRSHDCSHLEYFNSRIAVIPTYSVYLQAILYLA